MKTILVGIDFTEADDKVLTAAKELAKALQAELHLLHVIPLEPAFVGFDGFVYPGIDEREEERQREKASLKEFVDNLKKEGYQAHASLKEGTITASILEFAEKHDEGLLVIGTHSRNRVERALLGSTADRIIRKSKLPVLVVPTM